MGVCWVTITRMLCPQCGDELLKASVAQFQHASACQMHGMSTMQAEPVGLASC